MKITLTETGAVCMEQMNSADTLTIHDALAMYVTAANANKAFGAAKSAKAILDSLAKARTDAKLVCEQRNAEKLKQEGGAL